MEGRGKESPDRVSCRDREGHVAVLQSTPPLQPPRPPSHATPPLMPPAALQSLAQRCDADPLCLAMVYYPRGLGYSELPGLCSSLSSSHRGVAAAVSRKKPAALLGSGSGLDQLRDSDPTACPPALRHAP